MTTTPERTRMFDYDQWVKTLAQIPDDRYYDCVRALNAEPERRKAEQAKQQAQIEAITQLWETMPNLKPQYTDTPNNPPAWTQPNGPHDAYPPNAWVTHNTKTWQNTSDRLNTTEPGTDPTWAEHTPLPDHIPN